MNNRWQEIETIFNRALERAPADRDAWLNVVCAGDGELQAAVGALLSQHTSTGNDSLFQLSAAVSAGVRILTTGIAPGQFLGPYRIDSFVAAGGMGMVYRAHDTVTWSHGFKKD